MGYCIRQVGGKFSVKAGNFPAALSAIQSLHGKETVKDSHGRHFSWVNDKFYEVGDFVGMMQEWRYRLKLEGGDAVGIEFTGEKLGDDEVLFGAIAPFVESGSYLEFLGEDGDRWRWVFDGTLKEVHAETVWKVRT